MDVKEVIAVLNKVKLKREGIATLQIFFIFIFASLENLIRHSYGIVSGLVVFAMFILGNYFGRPGVAYVAAVTPPIAIGVTVLFWAIMANTIHVTKVAVELIGGLASVAPWLLLGALYGWYTFLHQRAQKKIATARAARA